MYLHREKRVRLWTKDAQAIERINALNVHVRAKAAYKRSKYEQEWERIHTRKMRGHYYIDIVFSIDKTYCVYVSQSITS